MNLAPVKVDDIKHWFKDFTSKSGNFEIPEGSSLAGIFEESRLVGYFVVLPYSDKSMDIVQGYLDKSARNKHYSKIAVNLLEQEASAAGFNTLRCVSQRDLKAYTKFMGLMGFKPERIVFKKDLKEI